MNVPTVIEADVPRSWLDRGLRFSSVKDSQVLEIEPFVLYDARQHGLVSLWLEYHKGDATDAELLASPQPVVPENQGVDQWPSMNTASITDDEGRAFLIRPAVCRRESGKVLRYPLAGGFLWTIIPKRFL